MKRLWKRIGLIGLVFAAVLFGGIMSACGAEDKAPSQVSAETISYDGSTITWAAPAGKPTSYTVDVNGVQATTYVTSFPYSASSNTQTDTFTITIIAKNAKGESEPSNRLFTRIPSIDINDVTFDEDGKMSWSGVEGAAYYLVRVNNKETQVTGTEFSDFAYDNSNSKIEIKPVGPDGTFSSWSDSVSKRYLASPTDIKYDGTTLSWKGNSYAQKYEVYINGVLEEETNNANLVYSTTESFTAEVKALGNGENTFSSKLSEETEFLFLGTVQNVHVEAGVLMWDPIEEAELYEVSVNNITGKQAETQIKLTAGRTQNVKIRPLGPEGSNFFSNWSPLVSYNLLNAPSLRWNDDVTLDGQSGQNLTWSLTDSSTGGQIDGYTIEFQTPDGNKDTRTTNVTQPYFEYDYPTPGKYIVRVKTNATEDSGYYDSAYSAEAEIIRLAAPQKISEDSFVTSDPIRPSQGFTVKFKAGNVSGTYSYSLWKDGERLTDGVTLLQGDSGIQVNRSAIVGDNYREQQDIVFGVQSIGSRATTQPNGSLRKVLDSLSADNLSVPITVLPVPVDLNILEGDSARVEWDPVAGANYGYGVQINDIVIAENSYYDIGRVSPGTHTLSVCAAGDGHRVLASAYTAELTVIKLQTPTGLRVKSGEQEGKIEIGNYSADARSYNLYFNGDRVAVPLNTLDNINDKLAKGETTVTVVAEAVANYWNSNRTQYFITSNLSESKQFTKLEPVTFPKAPFTDTEFIWNAPANASNKALSYRVYDNGGFANPYVVNSTKMDISTLKPGSYLFSVVALNIGCEEDFFNSDMTSMEQTVTKLEAPVVTHNKTAYIWNPVPRATSYNVRVGSTIVKEVTTGGDLTWVPNFTDERTYEVTVTAVGDGTTSISTSSEPIRQIVTRLQAPSFECKYNKDCYSTTGRLVFTVDTSKSDKNTQAYTYKVNGVVAALADAIKDTEHKYDPGATGKFSLTVMAVGKAFGDGEDNTYYIDSLDAVSKEITLFAAPSTSGNSMYLDNAGFFNWSKVEGCTSYKLVVHFEDGSSETITSDGAATTKLVASMKEDEPHYYKKVTQIEIQAMGNGTTTVSSQVAVWKKG